MNPLRDYATPLETMKRAEREAARLRWRHWLCGLGIGFALGAVVAAGLVILLFGYTVHF